MTKDHLGTEFDSISKMCSQHNISPNLFNRLMRNSGGDLEVALAAPKSKKMGNTEEANQLKELRWRHNLFQTEVAEMAGISPGVYIQTEQGYRKLSVIVAIKIANAYHVSTSRVLGVVEDTDENRTFSEIQNEDEIKQIIVHRLLEIRKELGVNEFVFAKEYLGCSLTTVCNIEAGKRLPNVDMVKHLAEKTGKSIDYILGREE